ncbi:MAG: hypothetical protein GY696_24700 [Gammaproteobacteria bacterium]|nr:hypothetical protein [Gammaproteobacteria bacterium]
MDELRRNATLDPDTSSETELLIGTPRPLRQAIGLLSSDIFPEDLDPDEDIKICHVIDRDGSHDPMYPESMELHFFIKQDLLDEIGDELIGANFIIWRLSIVRKQISPLLVMEIRPPFEADDESLSNIDADVYIYRNYIIAFYCLSAEDSNRARILVFKKDSGILLKSVNLIFPFPLSEIYCMEILPGPNRTLFVFSQSNNDEGFSFRILKFQLEGNESSTPGEVVHDQKVRIGTNLKYTVMSDAYRNLVASPRGLSKCEALFVSASLISKGAALEGAI